MKKIYLIIFSFLFAFNLVNADEGEFKIGVELGYSPIDLEAEDTAQSIANQLGSTVTTEYDTGVLIGRLFGDYGLSSNLGIEAGYFRTTSATATYKSGSDSASESYTITGFDIAAKIDSGQGLFGKFGMHSSTIDGEATVKIGSTTVNATGSTSGTGMLFGAGFEADGMRYSVTQYNGVGGADTNLTFLSAGIMF